MKKLPVRKFYWAVIFVDMIAIISSASRNALGFLNIIHAGGIVMMLFWDIVMMLFWDYSYWKNEMLNTAKNIAEAL